MTKKDFESIHHFTQKEIEATGAKIKDVKFELIKALDNLRGTLGVRMFLQKNGLTTGDHSSPEHAAGLAVDWYVTTDFHPMMIMAMAVNVGFKIIGIYWNGKMLSYHTALSPYYKKPWLGRKDKPGDPWKYETVNLDPRIK